MDEKRLQEFRNRLVAKLPSYNVEMTASELSELLVAVREAQLLVANAADQEIETDAAYTAERVKLEDDCRRAEAERDEAREHCRKADNARLQLRTERDAQQARADRLQAAVDAADEYCADILEMRKQGTGEVSNDERNTCIRVMRMLSTVALTPTAPTEALSQSWYADYNGELLYCPKCAATVPETVPVSNDDLRRFNQGAACWICDVPVPQLPAPAPVCATCRGKEHVYHDYYTPELPCPECQSPTPPESE